MNNMEISKSHQNNDYFHATEDSLMTRSMVFDRLTEHHADFRVYSVIVQKNKANPSIRDPKDFFSLVFKRLISEVIKSEKVTETREHLLIMTDRIPVQRKRSAVIAALKASVKNELAGSGTSYSVRQMDSKSDYGLQAADYASWAVYRKWTNGDTEAYEKINRSVRREVDYFYHGRTFYY